MLFNFDEYRGSGRVEIRPLASRGSGRITVAIVGAIAMFPMLLSFASPIEASPLKARAAASKCVQRGTKKVCPSQEKHPAAGTGAPKGGTKGTGTR